MLHLSLGHLVQVDQGGEAAEVLETIPPEEELGPGPLGDLGGLHLALRVEFEEDGVKDKASVSTKVALLLLHLVCWGKGKGEDFDDGDVQDKFTVHQKLSTELKRAIEVGLVLVLELLLL